MKVVICCTRNWYWYLLTSIYALLKHNKVEKIYLFIEDDNIPFIKNDIIEFINVNKLEEFIHKSSPNYNTKYTKMTFVRCYLSKILKEDKILYIDADALVVDNIQELWDMNIDNYYIAGVKEPGSWSEHLKKDNMDNKYINTGVLLMNLKLIRQEKIDDKIIHLLNNNHYWFPDQDVINIVCVDKIKYISNIYNSTETTGVVDNAKIIHYIRERKGWKESSPRSDIWFKYYNEMKKKGGIDMEKCIVIEPFSLGEFDKLHNLQRANPNRNKEGYLFVGDKFECEKRLVDYLTKDNRLHRAFINVIDEPKKAEEPKEEIKEETKIEKPKKTNTRKRKTVAKK